ncbi:rRNA cytosine-C5-methyltransferase [Paenibacillus psychroresistens]|uniref:rRNA cytosine-C5-methyltransferase n=1 Tax=Paenibacillus psychroresistens TaxID=1778678 RepID=A0A6B8RM87_9BACL|nr:RsmB/NOP family class I SAM-dependent RNA methyltransferase [Paenibacillus psychroresistens]QGQ97420.1 rRNA cytosine-C5-methyltransferase [Paenibacillus psychroresistens]
MSEHLPAAFVDKMKVLLQDQFPAFLASYSEPRYYGLRINTLKVSVEKFKRLSPFQLSEILWAKEGFYYEEGERPGKHPYYNAGLYYIQEPTAMAPVEFLDIQPGDKVLDLCAAPGGKSTQIAAKLKQTGLIVVNDNHADRVKPLVKNLELFGVRNAVVLNELPNRLERVFKDYFDKILVDAPCSGEGMFRKEEEMVKQWDLNSAAKYALMQRDILKSAGVMLAPGGRLVYSTCTFSPEENEEMIAQFIEESSDFSVVPIEADFGFVSSKDGSARLWPHLLKGEGHYVAVLQRKGEKTDRATLEEPTPEIPSKRPTKPAVKPIEIDLTPFHQFCKDQLLLEMPGVEKLYGEHLYLMPEGLPSLDGIKVIKPGWYMGAVRKNRFEPAHALAMGLHADEAIRVLQLNSTDGDAIRYLKGETIMADEQSIERKHVDSPVKGHCLICIDGFPAGWGKWQEGMIKNEYPAGWRWMA